MIGKALWVVCTKLKNLLASKLKLYKNMENIRKKVKLNDWIETMINIAELLHKKQHLNIVNQIN